MDIRKSQRLSQYLGVVSDLVQYSDIGTHMVQCGTLTLEEHEFLHRKLKTEGNCDVMNEFLTMINLRMGGFDAFLQVLRNTDYVWAAEQLDPGKCFTEPPSNTAVCRRSAKVHNLIANVRQSINRKSETNMFDSRKMNDEELTFMSYRGSCPIDIPINPGHYIDANNKQHIYESLEHEEMAQEGLPETHKNDVDVKLMNLELTGNGDEQNSNNIALVDNVPGSLINDSPAEYFTRLAKRLDVPTDLKVIRRGKIAKTERRGKISNVRLQFQSEKVRNHFIANFKEFIVNLEPNDELYSTVKQLNISVPKPKCRDKKGKVFKKKSVNKLDNSCPCPSSNTITSTATSTAHVHSKIEPSKKHWYQHSFSLKSWRKKKDEKSN